MIQYLYICLTGRFITINSFGIPRKSFPVGCRTWDDEGFLGFLKNIIICCNN